VIRIVAAPDDALGAAVKVEAQRRGTQASVLSLRDFVDRTTVWRDEKGSHVEPDLATLFRPHMIPADDPESDEAFLQGEYWAAAVAISQLTTKPFLGRYGFRAEPHLLFPPTLPSTCSGLIDESIRVVRRQQWIAAGCGLAAIESRADLLPYGQSILDGRVHDRNGYRIEGDALRTSARDFLRDDFSFSYVGCVCGRQTRVYSTFHFLDTEHRTKVEKTIAAATSEISKTFHLDVFAARFAVSSSGDAITLIDADPFPPQYPSATFRTELASLCVDHLVTSQGSDA
jgi:hypothetical protein